jgi:hypothetical protein
MAIPGFLVVGAAAALALAKVSPVETSGFSHPTDP